MSLFVYCFLYIICLICHYITCHASFTWMKFILFGCKPGSPVVLPVDCSLPKTHILSSEPTTHCDKDHHGYAMMGYRDKLYCSDQRGAPGVTSWEVRRPSLWGSLTYLLPMLQWPIKPTFRSAHVNCIALCMCLAIVWTMMSPSPTLEPIIIVWTLYATNKL